MSVNEAYVISWHSTSGFKIVVTNLGSTAIQAISTLADIIIPSVLDNNITGWYCYLELS